MSEKYVYSFGGGKAEGKADMKNLLGGKGANLAEMNLIGVPVPAGFTISTDACTKYYEIGKEAMFKILESEVKPGIASIEKMMGATFGSNAEAGTIRGDFGISDSFNLIHGSDSPEAAAKELDLFFDPEELVDYQLISAPWIYDEDELG